MVQLSVFSPSTKKQLHYLKLTGREKEADITEAVAKAGGLFYSENDNIEYTTVIDFDLATVWNHLSPDRLGPRTGSLCAECVPLLPISSAATMSVTATRQRSPPSLMNQGAKPIVTTSCHAAGKRDIEIIFNGKPVKISDGSVVIAAITSCTNTSNPHVLIGAGLMAREAVKRGIKVPGFVKTSFAPGSKVVSRLSR